LSNRPAGNDLSACGVTVRLGGVPVLRSVSVVARAGEVTGVIGPNGAGKSTLLRVLAGVLRAERGEVRLGAADLHEVPARTRAQRVAYLPQQDAAQPFTALETVLMARYPYLGRFQLEGRRDRQIARAALARTESGRFEARGLDRLSGGERQRVLLARALAQQAGALVLDEPLASLDLRHRLAVLAALRAEAGAGAAVVAALHDVELAGRYCDRLVLLAAGRVAACGAPREVLVPEQFRAVFGVEALVSRDSATGEPRVWLVGPSERAGAEVRDDPR
jgi:iron complex transport system ATP-binding protein